MVHKAEERCLGVDEKPLLVQLNWHKDDREGRFLLRRADEKSTLPAQQPPEESSFRRKLSKREKRNAKKENKLRKLKSSEHDGGGCNDGENGGKNGTTVAEKLYTELPETSFTRSISNPEAVMRRRRQQKLERKLQLFRSKDGGPDTGGTLKVNPACQFNFTLKLIQHIFIYRRFMERVCVVMCRTRRCCCLFAKRPPTLFVKCWTSMHSPERIHPIIVLSR